ncbi:exodeoxyribonuclease VII large subunit [Candidatus Entotheonella palauensis]|uniref:exodeoxyribonuclease VII large subunit n=1 Tax=Candidatus Entotheonella palauensis TaxID=93172 RepID=UPI002117665D|nr:exodeoxyribonuclease VII large subunit [Candidatus Entotheonella palauensis]
MSVPAYNAVSPQILTVSQVTREIRNLLEGTYPKVWIEGEISNLRVVHSGHAYFTLKDANSQLRAVIFRSSWRQLPFTPESGMHVVAQGRLSVYEPRGDYQLLATFLEPKGIGALQLAYEQLRDRLFQEGLFDEARKRPLPLVPQRIGIVTSPTGAAIRDIIRIVHRRRANVRLYLYPVRVQGQEATQEIVQGIARLNAYEPRPEVLIVGRGGGSLEDLWAFNEEQVARAIAASEIPVISAVGHEIDYTIADFVADLRASTPSAAAELVVKSEEELRQQLNSLLARMHTIVQYRHAQAQQALDYLFNSRPLREPHRFVNTLQQQVDDLVLQLEKGWQNSSQEREKRLENATRSLARLNSRVRWQRLYTHLTTLERRLQTAIRSRLIRRGETLGGLSSRLNALSPLAVLGRGYSLCREPISRQLVSRTALVHTGQQIEVLLQDGQLTCTVDDIDSKEPDYGRSDFRTGSETPGGNS